MITEPHPEGEQYVELMAGVYGLWNLVANDNLRLPLCEKKGLELRIFNYKNFRLASYSYLFLSQ